MAALSLGVVFIPGALAVHDTGAFELDGNATSQTTNDWDRVCHEALTKAGDTTDAASCGTNLNTSSPAATAVAWSADCLNSAPAPGLFGCGDLSATTFTGGGSKDPLPISGWAWNDGAGGLPAKDNLEHAYAARFSLPSTGQTDGACPNGVADQTVNCQVIYFGSDRYDNSGDAQQGFWFLQNKITLGSNKIGGGTGFTSMGHTDGDVLITSDFSVGGTTSTINVYKWDSTCLKAVTKPVTGDCADTNLRLLATSGTSTCDPAGAANDAFCGIVNPASTTVPWSTDFLDKSGNSSTYAAGELYEAGLNLSTLGLAGECFSSVVAETRSSQSTSAVLEDFIIGQFGVCAPHLMTQASTNSTSVAPGTAVHDNATVQVTGATSPADATGSVTFYLCSSTTAYPDCSTGGNQVGTTAVALVDTSSPANTSDGKSGASSVDVNTIGSPLAPGYYCFGASASLTNYASPARYGDMSNECFRVADTSSTATAQNWLPNDTATVTLGSGGAATSGSVTFTLYIGSGTCTTGADVTTKTYGPITVDSTTGKASTSNTTDAIAVTPGETISWQVTYSSGNANIGGSTSYCEHSTVTITDHA
jgi:hypothetical protein